jgi:hypothetical protein
VDDKTFAAQCGVDRQALRRWVGTGWWPLPHSYAGSSWLYRIDLARHYLVEGRWPVWARFAAGVGIGRIHTDPDPPPPLELCGGPADAGLGACRG